VNEQLDQPTLARLTTEITTAYVAHNPVPPSDLPSLIAVIAENLRQLGQPSEEKPAKPEPVVTVRRSVRDDHLVCLVCGQQQKLLKRHLATHHDLTPQDYRAMFALKANYPMVAPAYAAQRSAMAKQFGLGQRQPLSKPKRASKRKSAA
jgi:predicted transcriptional regulator